MNAVPPVTAAFVLDTATLKRRLAGVVGTLGEAIAMDTAPVVQTLGVVFVITALGVGSTSTVVNWEGPKVQEVSLGLISYVTVIN